MRQQLKRCTVVSLLLIMLLSQGAPGRVYLRWRHVARSNAALEAAGARRVYGTDVTLNGGRGVLNVHALDATLRETVASLRRLFPDVKLRYAGGSLAMGTVLDDNTALRIVALQPGSRVQSLVVTITQSRSDFEQSKRAPVNHQMQGLAAYPGSTPVFYAANDDTRLEAAMSEAMASPDQAQDYYQNLLLSDGWFLMQQTPSSPSGGSISFYARENRLCVVYAGRHRALGPTRITVLHKRMNEGI